MSPKTIPTLAEWLGGLDRLEALTARFYEKVPYDPVLATPYTDHAGSHAQMIGKHMGRHLTEGQRARWIGLMLETVDELGLPDDPEFRATLVGYFEWGTRLAVINSQDGFRRCTRTPRCLCGERSARWSVYSRVGRPRGCNWRSSLWREVAVPPRCRYPAIHQKITAGYESAIRPHQ
jgi:hemoglobin